MTFHWANFTAPLCQEHHHVMSGEVLWVYFVSFPGTLLNPMSCLCVSKTRPCLLSTISPVTASLSLQLQPCAAWHLGSWGATHVREASTVTVPNDAMRLFVPVALWSSQSGEMPRRYSSQDLALSLKNTWLCLFTVEWQLPKTEAALFGLGLALFVVFIQCFHNQPQSFTQLWSIASHRTLPWSSSEGRRYERILSRRRNLHPNGRHTYSSLEANRSWGLEKWLSS